MLVVANLGGWLALVSENPGTLPGHRFLDIFPTWHLPHSRSSSNGRSPSALEATVPTVRGVLVEQECRASARVEAARVQI